MTFLPSVFAQELNVILPQKKIDNLLVLYVLFFVVYFGFGPSYRLEAHMRRSSSVYITL